MGISQEDFLYIRNLVKESSGIDLDEDKSYLVETRLASIINKNACESISDLINMVRLLRNKQVITEIIDCMTTNETSFFRDLKPFEQLTKFIVPEILKNNNKIRIWSAASSTGQEAYSIAISLKENKHLFHNAHFEIIGTDISSAVVEKAKQGIYSQFEIQRGLPVKMLVKYFSKEGDSWRVNHDIRHSVSFQNANLLENLDKIGMFDIVFCRNVLIYFDQDTKKKVLENIKKRMNPHAILVLGSSESIIDKDNCFIEIENQKGCFRIK